jgi:hypothetical protein
MARYLGLLAIAVLGLLGLAACGHVTLGSTGTAVTSPTTDDWQYQDQSWPYNYSDNYSRSSAYRTGSRRLLNDAQALLYKELSQDLSDTLAAYRQVGVAGYGHVWPLAEKNRIKLLNPSYDRNSQVLQWGYENIGDFDLDGIVNSVDLVPVALYADTPYTASDDAVAIRDWLDSDGDGRLDRYNAQQIAMSYGRAVYGYNVLAGTSPDPAGMDPIGFVRFVNRLPGWPPRFELLVPSGYNYVCIQPLKYKQQVICSYIANLTGKPDQVSVLYPDQPAN